MKRVVLLLASVLVLVLAPMSPSLAAPSPNPNAPAHTKITACAKIFEHNPQASNDTHSSERAQDIFEAVGETFCAPS